MQTINEYIMRDQVRNLVPSIMDVQSQVRSGAVNLLRVAVFLGAAATYLAALTFSA